MAGDNGGNVTDRNVPNETKSSSSLLSLAIKGIVVAVMVALLLAPTSTTTLPSPKQHKVSPSSLPSKQQSSTSSSSNHVSSSASPSLPDPPAHDSITTTPLSASVKSTSSLSSSPSLPSMEVGNGVECIDEQPVNDIHRRCRLSNEDFLTNYYRLGVPVIIKDALPINQYSFATPQRLVQHYLKIVEDGSQVDRNGGMEDGGSMLMWSERDEDRGLSTIGDIFATHWREQDFNFTGSYFFLRDAGRLSRQYPVMRRAPYFIGPLLGSTHGYNPTIYYGGPAAGAPAHVDLGACMVSYQLQISGIKKWRISSPLIHSSLLQQVHHYSINLHLHHCSHNSPPLFPSLAHRKHLHPCLKVIRVSWSLMFILEKHLCGSLDGTHPPPDIVSFLLVPVHVRSFGRLGFI
jgi:hypothetical protein